MMVQLLDGRTLDLRHREGEIFWCVDWHEHYAVGLPVSDFEPMQPFFGVVDIGTTGK